MSLPIKSIDNTPSITLGDYLCKMYIFCFSCM